MTRTIWIVAALFGCYFLFHPDLQSTTERTQLIFSPQRKENDEFFVDNYFDPETKMNPGQGFLINLFQQQIDFLQYRNMCLAACRASLPEEQPSESSIHCRSDTLTPRWLDYIRNCELDIRKCEIKAMGCRGWIIA